MSRCCSSLLLLLVVFLFTNTISAQEQDACLECHGDESLSEDVQTKRLYVNSRHLEESVHSFLGCVDCHQDLMDQDPYGHESELGPADCSNCHPDIQEEYVGSLHGYARTRGNPKAPDCAGCHGTHRILGGGRADSPSHRQNIVGMCGSCHGSAGLLTDTLVRLPQAVQGYAQSVHGLAVKRGIDTAAVCSDCHGIHNLKGVLDPESKIHPYNVSTTCGKCHGDVQAQYDLSIHGRALKAGIVDSPTCNSCHGEHHVLSPKDPLATTYAGQLAASTCGKCHEDSRITEKYGLAGYVVETYVDSYHGWAKRLQSEEAATCVQCHTAHWVLPQRDPASTVSSENVVETCRQCHPTADLEFASSYTHRTASISENPITSWIRIAYLILIPVVIVGMLIHNLMILIYYAKKKRQQEVAQGTVLRLDKIQISQHMVLAISFIVLVITGFALRYPDAFWVVPLAELGMNEQARSVIHRIAATGLVVFGIFHMLYIAFSARGRDEFLAITPRLRDFTDCLENLKFYSGKRKKAVRFARYDYTQKAEYWALVWGTIVMAITGFILWFPATAVKYLPVWVIQASEVLHFYEAWLATLAIFVWHFFFVIFHPDVYPMSWTWLTGEMSRAEVRKHHSDWLEEAEAQTQQGSRVRVKPEVADSEA